MFDSQPQKTKKRKVISIIQSMMETYGYHLIETPIIEDAELFLTKAGDRVAEKLFTFERYGASLALRPEFTAAAAHLYNTRFENQEPIVRWQFSGPIFEDDPSETRHKYQQYSVGAELLGMDGPAAESEIINLAVEGITGSGVDDWKLTIGHVGLTRRLLERFNLDTRTQQFILNRRDTLKDAEAGISKLQEQLQRYLPIQSENANPLNDLEASSEDTSLMVDRLLETSARGNTMGGRTREDIARRLMFKRQQAAKQEHIADALHFLQGWMNINSDPAAAMAEIESFLGADIIAWPMFNEWQKTIHLLNVYGIPNSRIMIQPDLARTWDYYTGLVFEVRTSDGVQLAGGGRYDELTRLLGGDRSVPAVGTAYFIDHISNALPDDEETQSAHISLLCADNQLQAGISWAKAIRERGFPVSLVTRSPNDSSVLLKLEEENTVNYQQHSYNEKQIDFLVMELREQGKYETVE